MEQLRGMGTGKEGISMERKIKDRAHGTNSWIEIDQSKRIMR